MTVEVSEVVEAEIVRTSAEWAEVIKGDLGRAVEGIVSAGRNLIAAKADVAHGEWLPMLREVGISDGYARKLMSIGRTFSNRSYENDLPGNMTVLYELSRLDPDDIEAGIETGAITPKTTIKEAKQYASEASSNKDKEDKSVTAPAVEDARAHKSPFAEGTKLSPDTHASQIIVGPDGRAQAQAEGAQKALAWARENPRMSKWDAAKGSGLSEGAVSRAYSALRKNGEIPATGHTERSMADMFDLIAIGTRNVGTTIDQYADRIGEAEPDDFEYYWEEFDEAVKKINSFRREIKRTHNI